jgi:RNA recognition motif-containing protein
MRDRYPTVRVELLAARNVLSFINNKFFSEMNIFVAKLSSRTKSEDLEQLFKKFGEVTSAKVIMDRQTGFSKRYGFVEMPDEQAAYEAIDKLNDTELDGSQIVVKLSEPRSDNRKGQRPKRESYNRN